MKWRIISFCENCHLRLRGVELGKGLVFKGWSIVQRYDKSTIKIGAGSSFNSSIVTNPIGINHRCLITTMKEGAEIIIGEGCGFSGVSITSFKSVTIGNNVRIGANCVIMDGDFHLDDPRVSVPKPVKICDNVWLGYGVIVMKGVTIGENTVIGVNSVVTKDIPANVVAAGNPCKVIKNIESK